MVETRSQVKGQPLKKPGAYNTDAYYQEKDEGYGDVGVDQEPDAGAVDNPEDRDFTVTAAEDKAATRAAQEDLPAEDVQGSTKEELRDLQTETTGAEQLDDQGEPVPVVEGGFDDAENHPEQERAL
jgi:hypothetical protein